MKKQYDVIIVGGGPAGIFAALELVKANKAKDILLLERGKDIYERKCPVSSEKGKCVKCSECSIMCGWGGAGAFSDGKLTLTTQFGGWLSDYIGEAKLTELIEYVDRIYLNYGATKVVYGDYDDRVKEIERGATIADLKLIPARIRHLGTEHNVEILKRIRHYLEDKITVKVLTKVDEILVENRVVQGIKLADGTEYHSKYVIVATGRSGAQWFNNECRRLNLELTNNQVDIGVRVEVPASTLEHITQHIYESKLIYYTKSFDDKVRTFCMNPYGEVVLENTDGLITVNGHSYASKRTHNTNFAILVSKRFTQPFKEPITYGRRIASLANILGNGVLLQRFGDLKRGRRSTEERILRGGVVPTLHDATPGDLSLVLPYRHMVGIIEMLEAMDKIAPGVASEHTLLYGVEVKFYSSRLNLGSNLETEIENLFAAGDGGGVTRGLIQASVSGVVAAREINRRRE